mmetsp:Transcript_109374/g.244393  ORF Transcript_109374/g.244393 Transcript_109374/m.244393 type:complete len:215 (+) Transcript_109374:188-832(+)|eukprot:CAMPEP_0180693972 /NCGR_PEP_ID=MMETSP1038_2-20121128/1652_1 /TAXON_ID=632150 /ORGANISM="Azadinium spinosum, Strain 3D9" /LENGTH=214 /DNA_ID=CAMNT_0022725263 /DNA_START=103 /DNA_END=747 /DNA_ORIENTATION=-
MPSDAAHVLALAPILATADSPLEVGVEAHKQSEVGQGGRDPLCQDELRQVRAHEVCLAAQAFEVIDRGVAAGGHRQAKAPPRQQPGSLHKVLACAGQVLFKIMLRRTLTTGALSPGDHDAFQLEDHHRDAFLAEPGYHAVGLGGLALEPSHVPACHRKPCANCQEAADGHGPLALRCSPKLLLLGVIAVHVRERSPRHRAVAKPYPLRTSATPA